VVETRISPPNGQFFRVADVVETLKTAVFAKPDRAFYDASTCVTEIKSAPQGWVSSGINEIVINDEDGFISFGGTWGL